MIVLGFGFSFLGFILLSLSLSRHHRQVWSQATLSKARRVGLRVVGYGCLVAALCCCMWGEGGPSGSVLWFGVLTAAALLQAMLLAYRPAWVMRIGGIVLTAGLVAAVL